MKSPQIIKVGNRLIGPGQPIFLTAEIGISHSGSFENAERMIIDAAKAGCDGVDMFIGDSNGFYFAPGVSGGYTLLRHDCLSEPKPAMR